MKLVEKACVACAPGCQALTRGQVAKLRKQVGEWKVEAKGKMLHRLFTFDSYWAGLGFVNAVAWIAQQQKHHPDIELGYKKVGVSFTTHAAKGLTENDFICAAKVDALLG